MTRRDKLLALGAGGCLLGFACMTLAQALPWAAQDCARTLLGGALLCALAAFALGAPRRRACPVKDGLPLEGEEGLEAPEGSGVTFAHVAANEEARSSLMELADYLKHSEKYEKMGARMPRGVLLYGPPGTGKTLLARALAGEAGVPFYALSGSDFVQMYVGVGASRVRALFQKARKAGKCVLFIDEIDALGKKRDQSANDEREQTLNALLSEMSGFRPCSGVLVLAATNRLDTLDPALLRPGRFDRQIEVGLPNRQERKAILALHLKGKPLDGQVDLDQLAAQTVSFSGASLESLINEAAIRAAGRGARAIAPSDIQQAFVRTVAGADKQPVATREELAVIALHEAGHALATRRLLPEHQIARVSILPTARGAAGYNLTIPPERAMANKADLRRQLQVLLAGRAAELLVGGEEKLTSGAMNDLARAADLAGTMVMDLGMEGAPCLSLRQMQKALGSQYPQAMDMAQGVLETAYRQVTELLTGELDTLMALTQALLDVETLSGAQLDAYL